MKNNLNKQKMREKRETRRQTNVKVSQPFTA